MIYRLTNPYHTQRNNRHFPASTCNTTAMVMALLGSGVEFSVPPGVQPEDYLTELTEAYDARAYRQAKHPHLAHRRPREVHAVLSWVVNTKLIGHTVTQFTQVAPVRYLLWRLAVLGRGAVVSGPFTPEGHMVSLAGFETDQEDLSGTPNSTYLDLSKVRRILIDDPWGDYREGYRSHSGDDISLTLDEFNRFTRSVGNLQAKWAHLIARDGNFVEES